MKHILKLMPAAVIALCLVSPDLFAAKGTTGTPLGGLGAAYIVYNGQKSIFVKGYRLTGQHWYQETAFNASFNLYTNVDGTVKTVPEMKSNDEDATIPIYKVNYAEINKIKVDLLAFGPYVSGDEKSSVMPLAFFEFNVENKNSKSAEAAIAFQISGLAGENPIKIEDLNGVYWDKTASRADSANSALVATSDMSDAQITTGGTLKDFFATGTCMGTGGGIAAVKLTLPPNTTGKIRFVVGWYLEFKDITRFESGPNGLKVVDEGFRYQNDTIGVKSSIDAVRYGLSEFVRIRDGASDFANRVLAIKGVPEWYKDRLLNNLYPLTHNSQYTRDGRFAWREGKYYIIGTIDQQGHAQIASSYNWPEGQWRQMQFWARTQRNQDALELGQIHHDFNGPQSGTEKIPAMCAWDDTKHPDYWWSPTRNWSDLNSLFLVNIYELFLATGNMEWLDRLWPYMMNTAQQILRQADICIDKVYLAPPAPYDSTNYVLPNDCRGSYDREGATNEYNGSLALVAYSALAEMCLARGDTAGSEKWNEIFRRGKEQFSTLFSSKSDYGTDMEGQLGVYNFSRSLGLPTMMSDEEADNAFDNYWERSNKGRDLLPWHFYTINHFGDFGIASGKVDEGLTAHYFDWEQCCKRNPNLYFWQDLDATPGMHSYMTAPVVWHSYMLISGYCMDKHNQRLWIRPMLPNSYSDTKGSLTNAPLISPGNWGNLDYFEEDAGEKQEMSIRFDHPMTVKEIRLKNPSGKESHTIMISGAGSSYKVEYPKSLNGNPLTGLDAIIRIIFDNPIEINSTGIKIGVNRTIGVNRLRNAKFANNLTVRSFENRQVIDYSVENKGNVSLAVYLANGVMVRKFDLGIKNAGKFTQTIDNISSGYYFLRLIHNGKCISTSSMVVTQ